MASAQRRLATIELFQGAHVPLVSVTDLCLCLPELDLGRRVQSEGGLELMVVPPGVLVGGHLLLEVLDLGHFRVPDESDLR